MNLSSVRFFHSAAWCRAIALIPNFEYLRKFSKKGPAAALCLKCLHHRPNTYSTRFALIAIRCLPSTVNEIGLAAIGPPV